jgi:hypothetical protein
MENNASRNARQDPGKARASGPIVFNFRAPGLYQSGLVSPEKQPSSSPTTKASGLSNQSSQALLDGKKSVYKSSKGFRVILNSVDEKKTANIKKIQSPNSSFVAVTTNPVSLTHLAHLATKPDENNMQNQAQTAGAPIKRFTSM